MGWAGVLVAVQVVRFGYATTHDPFRVPRQAAFYYQSWLFGPGSTVQRFAATTPVVGSRRLQPRNPGLRQAAARGPRIGQDPQGIAEAIGGVAHPAATIPPEPGCRRPERTAFGQDVEQQPGVGDPDPAQHPVQKTIGRQRPLVAERRRLLCCGGSINAVALQPLPTAGNAAEAAEPELDLAAGQMLGIAHAAG